MWIRRALTVLILTSVPSLVTATTIVPIGIGRVIFSGPGSPSIANTNFINPAINISGQDVRNVTEFDITAFAGATLASARLEFRETFETAANALATSELHGFLGNGALEIGDAFASNFLGGGYINGIQQTESLDVTGFVQGLATGGNAFAGFMLQRIAGPSQSSSYVARDLELIVELAAVPEPATMALLATGLLGARFVRRRRD